MNDNDLKYIGTKDLFNKILDNLQLTDRQTKIFILKYGRGLLNADIAEEINFCREIVSAELKIIRHKMAQIDIEDLK